MPADDVSRRITDLSAVDPIDFKLVNTAFLDDPEQVYERTGRESYDQLRHEIWAVRNGDLQTVLDRFPRHDPLTNQCAGWMHAVAGKHFFPDANHRTAMGLLRRLLAENGVQPGPWPATLAGQTVDRSHTIRRDIETVDLDTLYRRDALFECWMSFFQTVLADDLED